MNVMNSFKSYGVSYSNLVYEPYTPLYSFNAYREQTLGSGTTLGNPTPAMDSSYKCTTGVCIFYGYSGDINFGTVKNGGTLINNTTIGNVTANYGTNNGATTVWLGRINNATNGQVSSIASSKLFTFDMNVNGVGTPNMVMRNSGFTVPQQNAQVASGVSFSVLSTTIAHGFYLWISVVNGTTQSTYLNNSLMNSATVTAYSNTSSTSDYLSFNNATSFDIDNGYFAHYDRPLSTTEMTKIYDSVYPKLWY